jgi:hypothetical protein
LFTQLARIPAKGNFKGNLAAGAVGVGQPLSQRDYWLCKQIAPLVTLILVMVSPITSNPTNSKPLAFKVGAICLHSQ